MEIKDLLIIACERSHQTANQAKDLLLAQGVDITLPDPVSTKLLNFDLMIELLSKHRFVTMVQEKRAGTVINNFAIQNSIREAEELNLPTPDMWIQFGCKIECSKESELNADRIAEKIIKSLLLPK